MVDVSKNAYLRRVSLGTKENTARLRYISDAFGCLLQRDKLFRGDYRHFVWARCLRVQVTVDGAARLGSRCQSRRSLFHRSVVFSRIVAHGEGMKGRWSGRSYIRAAVLVGCEKVIFEVSETRPTIDAPRYSY
jgi:hypothetical protein